jgi:glycerol-3-phosphate dehydrogenase
MVLQQGNKPYAVVIPQIEQLAALRNREFDLLVVGGGITGCAVARDAALRGLSVALVEQGDFASATSSRSSRLIHGGIRYLEHGHLRLVFEASAERRRLLRLAPHLVRPLEFTWPVYEGARVGRLRLEAGLLLYDALSAFRNVRRHRRLSRSGVLAREPALSRRGLLGGSAYFDAATDDIRLTLANALGAREAGAIVANHCRVTELLVEGKRVRGAVCQVAAVDSRVEIRARCVVNATGPWTDQLREMEEPGGRRVTRGSKGAHILVHRSDLGSTGALTLTSPLDGRVMFILPAGRFALIGTTETSTAESLDSVRATEGDVDYLLRSACHYFPESALSRESVVSAWAGVRPLAEHRGEHHSATREHAIVESPGGMVTVTGGKLTTYRSMASQVVDRVQKEVGGGGSRSVTHELPLPGGDCDPARERVSASAEVGEADIAARLVGAYGSAWREVWELARTIPGGRERLAPGLPYMVGEVVYGARHEMARSLGDLLIRRVPLAFETPDRGTSSVDMVFAALSGEPRWREVDRGTLLAAYRTELDRIFTIVS